LYNDVKTRLCKWHRLGYHSQAGNIMVCKVMLVSMATYNFSTHLPPEWLLDALIEDMDQFIWKSKPELDLEELGSERARRWLPDKWANLKVHKGGLGTMDLRCFSEGLMLAWIPKFLDPRRPAWKWILEHWLERASGCTFMDARAVLFSTATAGQINEFIPSPFWRRVIELWKRVNKSSLELMRN
jgi:hypothetical protein